MREVELQQDRDCIVTLVQNWALWRDSGRWDDLLAIWHDDGQMASTWFRGSAAEFVKASKLGWERGVSVIHFLGGTSVDLNGNRATSQTRMTISQRAELHGVICDCACHGRFFDFWEKRRGYWGLVQRQPIYERDRIDTVDPGATLALDRRLLEHFPEGYRHIAYLQQSLGMTVALDLPVLRGPEIERLYSAADGWLSGR